VGRRVLGDSLKLLRGILPGIAVGVVLLGEGVVCALDLLLGGHLLKSEDGCVGGGVLCALNALTVLKKNLERRFMGRGQLDLLIVIIGGKI
jgi:hypothetical protein